mmetsp:Transcript_6776/g.19586  ORF Transcript_6776/g.19586 Transcript_6776/m.19586 type:complete len:249 (-) Transcript_6776:555-1301(-)
MLRVAVLLSALAAANGLRAARRPPVMIFDAFGAALAGDSALPKSKGELFSRAAGAAQLAAGSNKRLMIESTEFSGMALNKLNDGSRSSELALDKFNAEFGRKIASAIGATLVVNSKQQLAKLPGGSKKACLYSDLDNVRGAIVALSPASAKQWTALATDERKEAVVVLNGVRNSAPPFLNMSKFAYAYYLRRLTYGLLFCGGVGRPWKTFRTFNEKAPVPAKDYGKTPARIEELLIEASMDLQASTKA